MRLRIVQRDDDYSQDIKLLLYKVENVEFSEYDMLAGIGDEKRAGGTVSSHHGNRVIGPFHSAVETAANSLFDGHSYHLENMKMRR